MFFVDRLPMEVVARQPSLCLRLARLLYSSYYPGKALRASATGMIESAVADDWPGALEQAHQHLEVLVRQNQLPDSK